MRNFTMFIAFGENNRIWLDKNWCIGSEKIQTLVSKKSFFFKISRSQKFNFIFSSLVNLVKSQIKLISLFSEFSVITKIFYYRWFFSSSARYLETNFLGINLGIKIIPKEMLAWCIMYILFFNALLWCTYNRVDNKYTVWKPKIKDPWNTYFDNITK